MIGIIATIKIKEGCEADFEAVVKELVAAVHANEPGVNFYSFHRGSEPCTYIVMEQYKDEDALKAHGASAHFKEIGGKMGPFMAGRPDIQRLDGVA